MSSKPMDEKKANESLNDFSKFLLKRLEKDINDLEKHSLQHYLDKTLTHALKS